MLDNVVSEETKFVACQKTNEVTIFGHSAKIQRDGHTNECRYAHAPDPGAHEGESLYILTV